MTRLLFSSLLKHRFRSDVPTLTGLSSALKSKLSASNLFALKLFEQNKGVAIALLIVFTWTASIAIAFTIGAEQLGLWGCLLLIPWLMFLYTGLFVTGHDAMHGTIAPKAPPMNRAFGELALFLYGLIPYETLQAAHSSHHQYPASYRDPDFHNGYDTHPLLWYFRFMRSYWTLRQTIGLVFIYNSLYRICGVPEANLLIFWAVPSLLSSMQLFYFGTYLVHRKLPDTYSTALCANSNYWPWWISLLTCYHFGYHREHHAFPEVPWWQLPHMALDKAALDQMRRGAAYISTANHRYTSGGSALATISKPFVQRDRTRLKT